MTDYGRPKKLFSLNPEILGWGRQIGQINSGVFGVFSAKQSAPMFVQFLIHFFHYSTIISKKKPFYQIPNIYSGLGSEFGPQKLGILAFVCPKSVSGGIRSKRTASWVWAAS